jgi:hypothetical protein
VPLEHKAYKVILVHKAFKGYWVILVPPEVKAFKEYKVIRVQ